MMLATFSTSACLFLAQVGELFTDSSDWMLVVPTLLLKSGNSLGDPSQADQFQ